MNVLEQPNRELLVLLGENPYYKNKKYRFNKYCLFHKYKGVNLIHNAMTRSSISISDEELEKIDLNDLGTIFDTKEFEYVDFLIKNYFLVLEDFNEAEQTDWMRTKYRKVIDDAYLSEVYDYILYPTTTCNARCFYCYEKPMKKMPMTIEMAEKVANYIMKKAKDPKRSIQLRWFGGEPLYNVKAMRHIMTILKNNDRQFHSSIISNAYLFSDKMVEEAKNEWNLSFAQITLDGTEEVYNKAKNYIYTNQDKVSPFMKVIDNIDRLTSNGINVSIRMNCDMYNAENLKELVRYLHTRFPENDNLSVYVYPIFEDEEKPRTEEEREALFKKIFEVEDVMNECGFVKASNSMGNQLRYHHCMVDSNNSLNIHPDGTLGLCEHYIDCDILGNIDDDVYDPEILHSWRDYITDDNCKNCPIYPSCLRVKKCNDLKLCDKWFKEFRLRHNRKDLEGTYDAFMNRQNGCSNNSCNRGGGYACECVSQRCDDYEGQNDNGKYVCECVSQRCDDYEGDVKANNERRCIAQQTQNECYCVSQRCEDKENWCYCISQKQEVEEHKCEGGTCTCKKEEKNIDETPKQVEEVKEKESWYKRILNIFK